MGYGLAIELTYRVADRTLGGSGPADRGTRHPG
jgi:hypothetical protein